MADSKADSKLEPLTLRIVTADGELIFNREIESGFDVGPVVDAANTCLWRHLSKPINDEFIKREQENK